MIVFTILGVAIFTTFAAFFIGLYGGEHEAAKVYEQSLRNERFERDAERKNARDNYERVYFAMNSKIAELRAELARWKHPRNARGHWVKELPDD